MRLLGRSKQLLNAGIASQLLISLLSCHHQLRFEQDVVDSLNWRDQRHTAIDLMELLRPSVIPVASNNPQ